MNRQINKQENRQNFKNSDMSLLKSTQNQSFHLNHVNQMQEFNEKTQLACSARCPQSTQQQPDRFLKEKEINVTDIFQNQKESTCSQFQKNHRVFHQNFIEYNMNGIEKPDQLIRVQDDQENIPMAGANPHQDSSNIDENFNETAQWDFGNNTCLSAVSATQKLISNPNISGKKRQLPSENYHHQVHQPQPSNFGPRLHLNDSNLNLENMTRTQQSVQESEDGVTRGLEVNQGQAMHHIQQQQQEQVQQLQIQGNQGMGYEFTVVPRAITLRDRATGQSHVSNDRLVEVHEPVYHGLSPSQIKLLEEKLEKSEQKLGPQSPSVHKQKLLIQSSTPSNDKKSSDPSVSYAVNFEDIKDGQTDDVCHYQFDNNHILLRQPQNQPISIINNHSNPIVQKFDPNACQNSSYGLKSELTVIKSEQSVESKSSRGLQGITSRVQMDLKNQMSRINLRNRLAIQNSDRQISQGTTNRMFSSRNGLPNGDQFLESNLVSSLSRILDPQISSQQATSHRTVERTHEKLINSRLDTSSGERQCQVGSMTQILTPDQLKNIQEEREDRNSENHEIEKQQNQDNKSRGDQVQFVLQNEMGAFEESEGQGIGIKVNLNESSLTPVVKTPTPTISVNEQVHHSALLQNNDGTFNFPENSQSESSRPIYYHESVIERSNDGDVDGDGEDTKTGQMYVIPSYSALDKSLSHTRTASLSKSNCQSAKLNMDLINVCNQQNPSKMLQKSLNTSSKISQQNVVEGFGYMLSSDNSIQQLTQNAIQEHDQFKQQLMCSDSNLNQQMHIHKHVKSIVFEELSEKGRNLQENKNLLNPATSDSKKATLQGKNQSCINEFLTFAHKLSRSSNGNQNLLNQNQQQQQLLVQDSLPIEYQASAIDFYHQGTQQQLTDLDCKLQDASIEQQIFEETREVKMCPTDINIQSNFQMGSESENLIDFGDPCTALHILHEKNYQQQQKSSSKVNSMYLNVNGSQSIQSTQRLVDAESSTQSMPKTEGPAISGIHILEMCSGIDALPQDQAQMSVGMIAGQNNINSWQAFNNKYTNSSTAVQQKDNPYSNQGMELQYLENMQNIAQGISNDEFQVQLNQDLPKSPPDQRLQDQTLYEASYSRNLRTSGTSLYSDSEQALKNQWEQHMNNQKMLRNKQEKLQNKKKSLTRQSTQDIHNKSLKTIKMSLNQTSNTNLSHNNNSCIQKIGSNSLCFQPFSYPNGEFNFNHNNDFPQSLHTKATSGLPNNSSKKIMISKNSQNYGPNLHNSKSQKPYSSGLGGHNTALQRPLLLSNISSATYALRNQHHSPKTATVNPSALTSASAGICANHRVYVRNCGWRHRVCRKQEQMREQRQKTESQKVAKECSFQPRVIGFNYDNSGLTEAEKRYYEGVRERSESCGRRHMVDLEVTNSTVCRDMSVQQRCFEWLRNKQKNIVKIQEQVQQKEDQECTFQPKINTSAKSASQNRLRKHSKIERSVSKGFMDRQNEWDQKVKSKKQLKKYCIEQKNMEETTFRPKLAKASSKIWSRRQQPSSNHNSNSNIDKLDSQKPADQSQANMEKNASTPKYQVNIYVDKMVGVPLQINKQTGIKRQQSKVKQQKLINKIDKEGQKVYNPVIRPRSGSRNNFLRCQSTGQLQQRRIDPDHGEKLRKSIAQQNSHQIPRNNHWQYPAAKRPSQILYQNQSDATSQPQIFPSPALNKQSLNQTQQSLKNAKGVQIAVTAAGLERNQHLQLKKNSIFEKRGSLTERNADRAKEPFVFRNIEVLNFKQQSENLQNNQPPGSMSFSLNLNNLSQSQNINLSLSNIGKSHSDAINGQNHHEQPTQKEQQLIPGRIYKQAASLCMHRQQSGSTQNQNKENKPSYYTEASQQISEAIAHLQKINKRYGEKRIQQSDLINRNEQQEQRLGDSMSQVVVQEQIDKAKTDNERIAENSCDRSSVIQQKENTHSQIVETHAPENNQTHNSSTNYKSYGVNISEKEIQLENKGLRQQDTNFKDESTQKTSSRLARLDRDTNQNAWIANQQFQNGESQSQTHQVSFANESAQCAEMVPNHHIKNVVGVSKLGRLIEEKREIIRSLRSKQKEQGMQILRGVLQNGVSVVSTGYNSRYIK